MDKVGLELVFGVVLEVWGLDGRGKYCWVARWKQRASDASLRFKIVNSLCA